MRRGVVWQGMVEPGSARLRGATPRSARHGAGIVFAGLGCAARRLARHCTATHGAARDELSVASRREALRCEVRRCCAWSRSARHGPLSQRVALLGEAARRLARWGSARHGQDTGGPTRGMSAPRTATHGTANNFRGEASRGRAARGLAGLRRARPRKARQRAGKNARQGRAPRRDVRLGAARLGMVRRGTGAIFWAGRSWAGRRHPWNGTARAQVRRAGATLGAATHRQPTHGTGNVSRLGVVRPGLAAFRTAMLCRAGPVEARHGYSFRRSVRLRALRLRSAAQSTASRGTGKIAPAGCGEAWLGLAWLRVVRRRFAARRLPRCGDARHGNSWSRSREPSRCHVWHCMATPGHATHGTGKLWQGRASPPTATHAGARRGTARHGSGLKAAQGGAWSGRASPSRATRSRAARGNARHGRIDGAATPRKARQRHAG